MNNQYPSDGQLERIKNWDASDFHGLMEYIKTIWAFVEWGWTQDGNIYRISTGGWSGNEDIIGAMKENSIWWILYWEQSNRGGHYIFAPMSKEIEKKDDGGTDVQSPE